MIARSAERHREAEAQLREAQERLAKYEKATEKGIEKIRTAYEQLPANDDPDYDYARWLEVTLHARTEEREWHRSERDRLQAQLGELVEATDRYLNGPQNPYARYRAAKALRAALAAHLEAEGER